MKDRIASILHFALFTNHFSFLQWHRWELNPHTPRFELGRSTGWRTVPSAVGSEQ
jgi:hypothetical protein